MRAANDNNRPHIDFGMLLRAGGDLSRARRHARSEPPKLRGIDISKIEMF